ncbi:hypothetical protein LCGC14_2774310 [marine sediment metagenome]|uniref:Uncharacterized protein n=1 Tax=marine sediment metagenome TaxID=412755 RepID=A0A0F8YV51_9ZZZZ
MKLPYASTSTGTKAREEILKILKRFGCTSVGFMDEFDTKTVILAFVWRERQIQLRASAQGWANAYLRETPWMMNRHSTKAEWEQRALDHKARAMISSELGHARAEISAVYVGR